MDAPSPANEKSRSWATIGHLLGLAIISGLPFSNILGPLIVYLFKKNEDAFAEFASREALNFQILISICAVVLIAGYIGSFFAMVLGMPAHPKDHLPPLFFLPFAVMGLFCVLGLFDIVNVVVAAIQTNKGEAYRYPISTRFVR